MREAANRATIENLIKALNVGDPQALDRVFTDEVVMEWPRSGERIVGLLNRREVYSRFPVEALPCARLASTTGRARGDRTRVGVVFLTMPPDGQPAAQYSPAP